MFLLFVVFGEWNYKCSQATQSFWKMPKWMGPICPQCLNILRSSPEAPLCLLESQYRQPKMHSYFGTQTAGLNHHSQKWSLHPSSIPQKQPNSQWGPRKKIMLAQFVTGKDDVTLTWPTTQSDLGRWWDEAEVGWLPCTAGWLQFSHTAQVQLSLPLWVTRNRQLRCWTTAKKLCMVLGYSWALQPASSSWSPHTRCSWWK